MSGVGDLTHWLGRRLPRPAHDPAPDTVPPPGPSVLLHGAAGTLAAGLAAALATEGQGLRLIVPDPDLAAAARKSAARRPPGDVTVTVPDLRPPAEAPAARALLLAERPAAVVHVGEVTPTALLNAAHDAALPTTILAPRLDYGAAWWNAGTLRRALGRVSRIFLTDPAARDEAIRRGIAPARVEVIAPLDPAPEPLRSNPRELDAMHALMQGRHVWLAAALPLDEAAAVLAAHRAVLAYNHRALLIVAPMDPDEAEPIAALAEDTGLTVARRAEDHEPTPEYQLLLAEDLSELGLWYRLASVVYMGGTLQGPPRSRSRSPFEPASIGSAIIHGPQLAQHAREWRHLDAARAARRIGSAEGLAQVAADLATPDQAATLALAAWTAATTGVATARHVARAILSDIDPDGPPA